MMLHKALRDLYRYGWKTLTLLGKLIILPGLLILTLLIIPVIVFEILLFDIPYIIMGILDGEKIRDNVRYLSH